MDELTKPQKEAIKKRRKYRCNRDSKTHRSSTLIIHHKNRNTHDNRPSNLRVLCKKHHDELHSHD